MPLVNLGRILAIAWGLVSLGVFVLLLDGFRLQNAIPFALWVAAPVPLAWWIGSKVAATTAARRVLVGGMAVAFGLGAWLYWDAFLGRSSREESLSGLIVIDGPLYQLGVLALLAAWLLSRAAASAEA